MSLLPSLPRLARFHLRMYSAIAWTTKAVTDFLWKDGVPALSVIWLGEPDLTEHESAPGAPPALAAIKSSDENLAAVLSALDRQAARETSRPVCRFRSWILDHQTLDRFTKNPERRRFRRED